MTAGGFLEFVTREGTTAVTVRAQVLSGGCRRAVARSRSPEGRCVACIWGFQVVLRRLRQPIWSFKLRSQPEAFVPPTVLDRPLLPNEDAALRWILWLEDFPGAEELRAQVQHVRATWGRTTEIDVEVTDAAPAPVSDGVLPVEAIVVDAVEEPEGIIMVWVERGYLAGLEYSWFTGRMPTEYPPANRLRPLDSTR